MPDLGAAGKPGISDSHLNLVGAPPLRPLKATGGEFQVRSEDAAKTKGNHGSRQSLALASPTLP